MLVFCLPKYISLCIPKCQLPLTLPHGHSLEIAVSSALPQKAGDFFIRTPKGGERQTGLSEPFLQLLERALAVGLFSGVKGKSSFEELSLQMLSKKLDIRQAWIH